MYVPLQIIYSVLSTHPYRDSCINSYFLSLLCICVCVPFLHGHFCSHCCGVCEDQRISDHQDKLAISNMIINGYNYLSVPSNLKLYNSNRHNHHGRGKHTLCVCWETRWYRMKMLQVHVQSYHSAVCAARSFTSAAKPNLQKVREMVQLNRLYIGT